LIEQNVPDTIQFNPPRWLTRNAGRYLIHLQYCHPREKGYLFLLLGAAGLIGYHSEIGEKMGYDTVVLFTRNGMGDAPQALQHTLVIKFLSLWIESRQPLEKILFYTEGVKLACTGSPVLEQLKTLESSGTELILCKTCLDFFQVTDQVQVGIVGGMGDILETMQKAGKVICI
jgi:peroxiredoxin family protein